MDSQSVLHFKMYDAPVANSNCGYAEDFYVERSLLDSIFRGGE
jgi:hypothetical protein